MNPILKAALASLRDDYMVTLGNVGAVVPESVLAPWLLARTADCAQPDDHEKEGASFLTGLFASFECAVKNDVDVADDADASDIQRAIERFGDEGHWHEYADGAVPTYTHAKWQTFVHLAAHEEDVTELVDSRKVDGDSVANAALYIIADRLLRALSDELADKCDEIETETETAE